MAKAAKIFAIQNGSGETTYTVPTGKYVVVNVYSSTTANVEFRVNSVKFLPSSATSTLKGMAFPAGTTLGAYVNTESGAVMVSGFEYDV